MTAQESTKKAPHGIPTIQSLRQKAAQSLQFTSSSGAPKKDVDQAEGSSGIASRLASKFPKQVSRKGIPAECLYNFQ